MRVITERRAATILYRLALSRPKSSGVYLVPANACPVVPLAILKANRDVEFLDIDNRSLMMDENGILSRLLDRTRPPVAGIIYIRTYGATESPAINFDSIKNASKNTTIVDDRCAAVPALDWNEFISSSAHIYLYSTGYGKHVDLGSGGYAFIDPSVEYQSEKLHSGKFRIEDYRTLDRLCKKCFEKKQKITLERELHWLDTAPFETEWNEYQDEIGILLNKMKEYKTNADAIYKSIIPESVFFGDDYNHWRHQICVKGKQVLLEKIFSRGLFASGHYNTSAQLFSSETYINSENLFSRVVNLFNDLYVVESQIEAVAVTVRDHLKQYY